MSSNGRGIVREVRVAVFAVISRHIRRRVFSCSLSLVLLLLLLLLRDALLLLYLCGLRLDGIFVVKKEIKRLLGSFFRPFLAIDPRKLSSSFFFRIFTRGSIFHIYTPQHTLLGGREREERTSESTRGKSKTRVCVSSVVRSKEREREKLCCPKHTTSREKMGKSVEPRLWINGKKTKRGKVIPCMEETTALMTALKKNNFDMSKCMRESDLLDKCTSTHAKTPKVKNTINFHLQRLARMAKVAR